MAHRYYKLLWLKILLHELGFEQIGVVALHDRTSALYNFEKLVYHYSLAYEPY